MKDEKQLPALTAILETLKRANESGMITDTIWHGPAETLFDFIENSIEALATANGMTLEE